MNVQNAGRCVTATVTSMTASLRPKPTQTRIATVVTVRTKTGIVIGGTLPVVMVRTKMSAEERTDLDPLDAPVTRRDVLDILHELSHRRSEAHDG
jgi:hypothetical protein